MTTVASIGILAPVNYTLRKKHRKNKEHAGLRQAGMHHIILSLPVCPALFPSDPLASQF
jgi:hypothetical protein